MRAWSDNRGRLVYIRFDMSKSESLKVTSYHLELISVRFVGLNGSGGFERFLFCSLLSLV